MGHEAGEVQGQTRQHARLINLLGVKQLICCVNKMDAEPAAGYKKDRYDEISQEMKLMLIKVGWPKQFVEKRVPIIPISGVYKIKGVGDVLTGRVEQGAVKPGEEVKFLPTHTAANACTGKVFTVEMHHKRIEHGAAGDNIGMNVKALNKENMPRVGDVMIYKGDSTLGTTKNFAAQVQVLDIPGEIKCGYSPIGHVRCGRAACRLVKINWKMGKETGGEKAEGVTALKTNDAPRVSSSPSSPWLWMPSTSARVSPALRSWMVTP